MKNQPGLLEHDGKRTDRKQCRNKNPAINHHLRTSDETGTAMSHGAYTWQKWELIKWPKIPDGNLGIPEIKKIMVCSIPPLSSNHKTCSKNPCRSNRYPKGNSGHIHHKMHFAIFHKYLTALPPPQYAIASFIVSAQSGKMTLPHITPSVAKDNQPSTDHNFFPLHISSKYTRR